MTSFEKILISIRFSSFYTKKIRTYYYHETLIIIKKWVFFWHVFITSYKVYHFFCNQCFFNQINVFGACLTYYFNTFCTLFIYFSFFYGFVNVHIIIYFALHYVNQTTLNKYFLYNVPTYTKFKHTWW